MLSRGCDRLMQHLLDDQLVLVLLTWTLDEICTYGLYVYIFFVKLHTMMITILLLHIMFSKKDK